jgi:hypothetical protein
MPALSSRLDTGCSGSFKPLNVGYLIPPCLEYLPGSQSIKGVIYLSCPQVADIIFEEFTLITIYYRLPLLVIIAYLMLSWVGMGNNCCRGREIKMVIGEGPPHARVMLIRQNPGADFKTLASWLI